MPGKLVGDEFRVVEVREEITDENLEIGVILREIAVKGVHHEQDIHQ